ncbi:MAG TPA: glycosyltransferase, partial [Candidatus Binatia bacterium]|nr:glycosyltransferase [Candidatus Binatia bacterium]
MKVWLPAIKGGSGVDIHTRRLARALERHGVRATPSWFSTHFQFVPFALSHVAPPAGVDVVHALSWSGFAFKRNHLPLVVTEQLDVLDPVYRRYKSAAQSLFHQVMVRRFMKKSFAAASAVTAVSRATAASLAHTVHLKTVQVIPN